jgi:calcineurin-like phosphoesterase family protein
MELELKMGNTWVFSDPHYNHRNIVRGVSRWSNLKGTRDFPDKKTHNLAIVNGINEVVPENGVLICLGDWSFGGIESIWEFRKQINCKTIHYVMGNHDHHIWRNTELPNLWYDTEKVLDEQTQLYFPEATENLSHTKTDFNAHARDVFTSCAWYMEANFNGQLVCFHHYGARVWNKSHKGSWMLHGHSHGNLPDYEINNTKFKTMDVGLDTHPQFRPYSMYEIKDIMKTREIIKIDHH